MKKIVFLILANILFAHGKKEIEEMEVHFRQEVPAGATALHKLVLLVPANPVNVYNAVTRMNANVNVRDDTGFTPLHYAAFIDNSQMIDTLVGLHAIVNAESDGGVTPLHIAAFEGKVNAVRALLRHHASLDATPAGTARDLATAKGHTSVVELLDAAAKNRQ